MKIRRFRRHVVPETKAPPVASPPRVVVAAPAPRVWSLLLPPGFSNDHR